AGAPDPRKANSAIEPRRTAFQITEADRRHWAYQPLAAPAMPSVRDAAWCNSPIDRFVLARLEHGRLQPGRPAGRYAWIRRVTFDLTGLPPSPAEIEDFLQDGTPNALAKVTDRLLASPAFGIHWARHWLDGVRYASNVDKGGYYRDWVVQAGNEDLPYDEFVRLQLAGDLIPAGHAEPR